MPVEAMRALDEMPDVEKTSLFGTAVHAVLRSDAVDVDDLRDAPRVAGARGRRPSTAVLPSLEDVFLDVVEKAGGGARRMRKALAVYRKELRQILPRSAHAADPGVRSGVLPAALRLRAELRHPARRARRRGSRRHAREPRAGLGVRELGLLRSASRPSTRRRRPSACSTSTRRARVLVIPEGFGRDVVAGRAAAGAGDHRRRQRQHRDDGAGLRGQHPAHRRRASSRPAGIRLGPPITVEPRIWYNPELRSTLFLVPGLIAYIAMITAVASTALSIVREKESGTMEQVRMAPIGTLLVRRRQDASRTS